MIFHCPAPIYQRFTISNFKCMFMWVIHLNNLVVTKRVLLSGGLKIQDDCQSWPLIAAKKMVAVTSIILKEIVRPYMGQKQKFFTLGLVFMTNDNVDNKNLFSCMTQGPFINCQLWKMAKRQKSEIPITRLVTNCHKFAILSARSIFVWWQVLSNHLQECHSSIKFQIPRWLPILPYYYSWIIN